MVCFADHAAALQEHCQHWLSQVRSIIGTEQQEQFDFTMSCAMAVHDMFASNGEWLPFYEYLVNNIDKTPFGPKNLKFLHAAVQFLKATPFALPYDGVHRQ